MTAAKVHDLTAAAELLHGDAEVVYGDDSYQGIAKRPEMADKTREFRVAMRPDKRRALPDTPDGRLKNLTRDGQGQHPLQSRASLPRDYSAVRFAEEPAARLGQEPLEDSRNGSTIESVPSPTAISRNSLTVGLV